MVERIEIILTGVKRGDWWAGWGRDLEEEGEDEDAGGMVVDESAITFMSRGGFYSYTYTYNLVGRWFLNLLRLMADTFTHILIHIYIYRHI